MKWKRQLATRVRGILETPKCAMEKDARALYTKLVREEEGSLAFHKAWSRPLLARMGVGFSITVP